MQVNEIQKSDAENDNLQFDGWTTWSNMNFDFSNVSFFQQSLNWWKFLINNYNTLQSGLKSTCEKSQRTLLLFEIYLLFDMTFDVGCYNMIVLKFWHENRKYVPAQRGLRAPYFNNETVIYFKKCAALQQQSWVFPPLLPALAMWNVV
jgi:hypothetical protein